MTDMKTRLFIVLACFCTSILTAQTSPYDEHVTQAEALYQKQDYPASAAQYSAAFESIGWKAYPRDRYNAARSWAMAGVPDSAFFCLYRLVNRANYDNLDELTAENDFKPLHSLPRWKELCDAVKANQPTMPELARELAAILEEDQKYRQMIDSVEGKFGRESAEMKSLWKIMGQTDSVNTIRIKEVLDTHGWLGSKAVGAAGNSALFLVIQHAEIEDQEKYLPMMREAVKSGNAEGSSLALLEDRVLMRNGKRQIYGSQVGSDPKTGEMYFFPIEDVDHVDERRASVGLGPLAEYAGYFNLVWDAAAIEKNRKMEPEPAEVRKKH